MHLDPERKTLLMAMSENIDHLITTQFYSAGGGSLLQIRPVVQDLYRAARRKFEEPLTYLAARSLMERVKEADRVLILTGFIVIPSMRPESDGPVGAASLARALHLAFGATPIIVTEKESIDPIAAVCSVTGLHVDALENACSYRSKVALVPFPLAADKAQEAAVRLLDETQPSAIVCIERPSWNEKGVYHNGFGNDVTCLVAKTDHLIQEAARRNILTIGIGDGGNEVGMGCIQQEVKEIIPSGARCGCPCNAGIAAATATDVLVVSTIANWGSYGIEALLAAAFDAPHILHSPATERRILEEASRAGIVDPVYGTSERTVDGTPEEISVRIVELLGRILEIKVIEDWGKKKISAILERRAEMDEMVAKFGEYLASRE